MKLNIRCVCLLISIFQTVVVSCEALAHGGHPEKGASDNIEPDYNSQDGDEDQPDIVKCKFCLKDIDTCLASNCRQRGHSKPSVEPPSSKRLCLEILSDNTDTSSCTSGAVFPAHGKLEMTDILNTKRVQARIQVTISTSDMGDKESSRRVVVSEPPEDFDALLAETHPIYFAMEAELLFLEYEFNGINILIILKRLHQLHSSDRKHWQRQVIEVLSNFCPEWLSEKNLIAEKQFQEGQYILWVMDNTTGQRFSALIVITGSHCLLFVLEDNHRFQPMIGSVRCLKKALQFMQQAITDDGEVSYQVELYQIDFAVPLWSDPKLVEAAIAEYECSMIADSTDNFATQIPVEASLQAPELSIVETVPTFSHSESVLHILNQDLQSIDISPHQLWAGGLSVQSIFSLLSGSLDESGDLDIETLQALFHSYKWTIEAIDTIESVAELTSVELVDGNYLLILYSEKEEKPIVLLLCLKDSQARLLAVQFDDPVAGWAFYPYLTERGRLYDMLDSLEMLNLQAFSIKQL